MEVERGLNPPRFTPVARNRWAQTQTRPYTQPGKQPEPHEKEEEETEGTKEEREAAGKRTHRKP
eukprot:646146-Rhodomonas_salina.1